MASSKGNDLTNKCQICRKPYTEEDMVECTMCRKWIHYECADVDDDVEHDETWKCPACISQIQGATKKRIEPYSPGSSKSNASKKSTKLKQLETIKERLNLIREKEQLLLQRSQIIETLDDEDGSEPHEGKDTTEARHLKPMTSNEVVNKFLNTLRKEPADINTRKLNSIRGPLKTNFSAAQRCSNVEKRPIVHHHQHDEQEDQQHQINFRQIYVRQSLAKELPTFTGKPEEWPVFISSYNYTTQLGGFNNTENMIRLNGCLKGRAREVVEPMLTLPNCVDRIIDTLQLYFGRPDVLIEHYISKVREIAAPKSDRLDSLLGFAIAVQNLCVSIEQTNQLSHLSNPMLIKELTNKLPAMVRMNWGTYKRAANNEEDLRTLCDFLRTVSEDLCAVGVDFDTPKQQGNTKKCNNRESVNIHNEQKIFKCAACEGDCKILTTCEKFKQLTINERWNIVKKHHICNRCLKKHRNKCEISIACSVATCDKRYHPILHKHNTAVSNVNHHMNANKVLFRVMPVKLFSGNQSISTFAFLDEGSSCSLITENVCRQLGLQGTNQPLCMKWTNNITTQEKDSQIVNLQICGDFDKANKLKLDQVRTIKSLKLPKQSLNYDDISSKYPHLKNLPIKSYTNADPQILIGLQNWKIAVPTKCKFANDDGPVAVKCSLGWTICANSINTLSDQEQNYHICECDAETNHNFSDMMNDFFTIDSLGISDQKQS